MSLTSNLSKVPQFKEIVAAIAPKRKISKLQVGRIPFLKSMKR